MHPDFNLTQESLEYTHCQFVCPWHETCKRFRQPRVDDARVYLYYVAPPAQVNGMCEMYEEKK